MGESDISESKWFLLTRIIEIKYSLKYQINLLLIIMKAFIRKIRSVKKRKLLKNLVGTVTAAASFRYGAMQNKTEPSPFFVNYDQSNQHLERPHPYHQAMIVDEDN